MAPILIALALTATLVAQSFPGAVLSLLQRRRARVIDMPRGCPLSSKRKVPLPARSEPMWSVACNRLSPQSPPPPPSPPQPPSPAPLLSPQSLDDEAPSVNR